MSGRKVQAITVWYMKVEEVLQGNGEQAAKGRRRGMRKERRKDRRKEAGAEIGSDFLKMWRKKKKKKCGGREERRYWLEKEDRKRGLKKSEGRGLKDKYGE